MMLRGYLWRSLFKLFILIGLVCETPIKLCIFAWCKLHGCGYTHGEYDQEDIFNQSIMV